MNEQKTCQSQQTRGKTCRIDPWLKDKQALWCDKCVADKAAEDAMVGYYGGMGWIV